jgi:transcription initiation factor TFIID subunit 2
VDPVLLGIPQYFEIIPRKDARDLRTIGQKLNNDKYDAVEAFEADLALMVQNAITFNGAESEVGLIALQMRNTVHEVIGNWKASANRKRKDGEKGTTQPTKKIKIG